MLHDVHPHLPLLRTLGRRLECTLNEEEGELNELFGTLFPEGVRLALVYGMFLSTRHHVMRDQKRGFSHKFCNLQNKRGVLASRSWSATPSTL